MGTAGYMAPEQAKGKRVDKRADIWAFGVVLYEIVTGRRLFQGEDLTETLAAVVMKEPDLSAASVKVRRLLGRCLEKDPKKRLRDIGDAWELLEDTPQAQAAPPSRAWLPWAVAGVLTLSTVTFALLWLRTPVPEARTSRFSIDAPPSTSFTGAYAAAAASPDGRYIVFGAQSQGATAPSLWLRQLDSFNTRPLPGTENGNFPFWSPDSRSIAFFDGGKLKRVDIAGGAVLVLCDADSSSGSGVGGAWNRDGVILFGGTGGLLRVPASGGVAERLTVAAAGETAHGFPQFLPDGRGFLYFIASLDPKQQGVYAASLDRSQERVRILATDHKAIYAPPVAGRPGHLVWLREQMLLAQPFDAARLRLEGEPTPVAESVVGWRTAARAAFWTSDAGLLVYRAADSGNTRMVWYGKDGKRLGEVGPERDYRNIRLSPDGSHVVFSLRDQSGAVDIWTFDFSREAMTRLTFDSHDDDLPVWSPDGAQIAFISDRSGVFQVYWKDAAGARPEEPLTTGPNPSTSTIGAGTGDTCSTWRMRAVRKLTTGHCRWKETGNQSWFSRPEEA